MELLKLVSNANISIVPIGDIHYGHPNCLVDLLQGTIEYVRKKRNCYVIGMGDYIESALRDSIGNVYEQRVTPEEQIEAIIDFLRPIKNKIICLLTGNHEERIAKRTSIDPARMIADALGVLYVKYIAVVKVKLGEQEYKILATPGKSYARTPGGKLNALLRLATIMDADVYLMGHLHDILTHSQNFYRMENGRLIRRKKYFVLTGSFLEYEGSYAERGLYIPGKVGVPKIKLFRDRYDAHISV